MSTTKPLEAHKYDRIVQTTQRLEAAQVVRTWLNLDGFLRIHCIVTQYA